jgi:CAAX protease family protein
LFLIPEYNGAGTNFVGISIPFIECIIGLTATAVIVTWVFNNTRGSLLLAMLLIASSNTAFNTFLLRLFPSLPGHAPVFQSLYIVLIVVALLIILATRGRLSYQRYQHETALTAPVPDREQEPRTPGTSE